MSEDAMIHVKGCVHGTRWERRCWRQNEEITWHPGAAAGVYRITEREDREPEIAFFSSVAESMHTEETVPEHMEIEP